jgi:hypothetical protein
MPTLTFHCVGGCWDRTQDYCDLRHRLTTWLNLIYLQLQHGLCCSIASLSRIFTLLIFLLFFYDSYAVSTHKFSNIFNYSTGSTINDPRRLAGNGELHCGVHGPVHVLEQVQGLLHLHGCQFLQVCVALWVPVPTGTKMIKIDGCLIPLR